MFIWRLWGDVWYMGDGEDYLTYLLFASLISIALAFITVIVIPTIVVPTLIFRAIFERKQIRNDVVYYAELQEKQVGSALALLDQASMTTQLSCQNCGWVSSQDIRPCVRCGR